jgi:hypothetical protein
VRGRAADGSRFPARLLYSARSLDEVIYRDELERPVGWTGYARRIDEPMLAEVA